MKDLPLTLTGHIKPGRVLTIIRADGTVYRHTMSQASVTINSLTYTPLAGLEISAIRHTLGGDAASMQIDVAHSEGGTFDTADINAGRFDFASVTLGIYDRTSASTVTTYFTGIIQPVSYTSRGSVSFDVRGVAADQVGVFTQKFQPMCRSDLGDALCRIPLLPDDVERNTTYAVGDFARVRFAAGGTPDDYANRYLEVTSITTGITAGSAPSFSSTAGNTTVDGGVTWTTKEAWTRWARVSSVTDAHNIVLTADPDATRAVDGWFAQGLLIMRSGDHAGWASEIGAWIQASKLVTTYLPIGALVAADDWLEIYPGCDKTLDAGGCPKFSNQDDFQGEPHFLGAKAASAVAE